MAQKYYYVKLEKLLRKRVKQFSKLNKDLHDSEIKEDLDYYDLIVAMDQNNLRNLDRMFGDYQSDKITLLMDHTRDFRDVSDPWYTGDFDQTYDDVNRGCHAILKELNIELE